MALIFLLLASLFSATAAAADSSGRARVEYALQEMAATARFNKFLEMAERAGLVTQLLKEQPDGKPLTILAPSDAGFRSLPPQLMHILEDVKQLRLLLEFHILPQYYPRDSFVFWKPLPTVAQLSRSSEEKKNSNLFLRFYPGVFVSTGRNVARLLDTVLDEPSTIAVYAVDKVLVPPSMLLPSPPPPPPPSAVSPQARKAFRALEDAGKFHQFLSLLHNYRLVHTIQRLPAFTLFAPTDHGFGLVASKAPVSARQVLEYHVVPAYYGEWDLFFLRGSLRTLASHPGKNDFVLSFHIDGNSPLRVDVDTGVVTSPLTSAVFKEEPVAIYSVENVLLPVELYGRT